MRFSSHVLLMLLPWGMPSALVAAVPAPDIAKQATGSSAADSRKVDDKNSQQQPLPLAKPGKSSVPTVGDIVVPTTLGAGLALAVTQRHRIVAYAQSLARNPPRALLEARWHLSRAERGMRESDVSSERKLSIYGYCLSSFLIHYILLTLALRPSSAIPYHYALCFSSQKNTFVLFLPRWL
jgi:hypothetical protein